MRTLLLVILMLLSLSTATAAAPAAAPAAAELSRGPGPLLLGMTRTEANAAFQHHHIEVMSESNGIVAVLSADPAIEFERYAFVAANTDQQPRLWQITISYRLPYDRSLFDTVEKELRRKLGDPVPEAANNVDEAAGFEHRAWNDGKVAVMLVAQPNQSQDDESERMLVVWTDRRLQAAARAQARPDKGSKSH